jgi:hypothetical protein
VKSTEAETELIRRLRLAGVGVERGAHPSASGLTADDVQEAWRVFKDFARVPVEDVAPEDDGILFDFDFLGGRRYHFSLVRQFSFEEDGEYDHMEQLHCCFMYEPEPELEAIPKVAVWSFDRALDDFFSTVEELPGFAIPLEKRYAPVGTWVAQEVV